MNINIRIKGGWKANIKNKSKSHCDRCGSKLWVAPDNKTIYCNGDFKQCTKTKRSNNDSK